MRHEHVMDGLFARGTARPPTESRALTGRSVAMQHVMDRRRCLCYDLK